MEMYLKIFSVFLLLCLGDMFAQSPKVLVVTAHPDDEAGVSVALYKITHELKGAVDLALITNGEGGYKYATLAEAIYGLPLTEEKVGREFLPSIRKKELMQGGAIMGIRNYYFFDQKDHKYTLDMSGVMDSIWDTVLVKRKLRTLLQKEHYDFVFCLLPVQETHAHHRSATILALQLVAELPQAQRPVILGYSVSEKNTGTPQHYTTLAGFPITEVDTTITTLQVDRTAPFSFKQRLNYKVIANWVIAEHKSQGTMQLAMNRGDYEDFYYFTLNTKSMLPKAEALFKQLQTVPFPVKEYTE